MKKIFNIVFLSLLFSLFFIIPLDNSNTLPALNSNTFLKSGYEDTLNLNMNINEITNIIMPEGEWNYKNPIGFYSKENLVNNSPTTIKIEEMSSIEITFNVVPDSCKFVLLSDNDSIIYDSIEDLFDSIVINGNYEITIISFWDEKTENEYYGRLDYKFLLNVNFPPNLQTKTLNNYPGNILILSIENIGVYKSEITTNLSHGLISTGEINNSLLYFIPVDIWTEPNIYTIDVKLTDINNNIVNLSKTITINSRNFPTQYLYVSDEVYAATNNDAAYSEFREKAQLARSTSEMKKYWEGKFILPVKNYKLSTDYGEIRYVNDQISSTRHSGLDLAAAEGTEIIACNNGKIVLSEYLILTGNTVIIDHGMGVFTSYYHMHSLNVSVGELVNKGDLIGTVGSTGFSTGPHLHWSISIFNTYVNTHQVIDEGLLD